MSSSSRRRHGGAHAGEHDNSERWLLTYADMITLLLALFVVLFAMSTINAEKFLAFRLGLTATFNPTAMYSSSGPGLLSQTSLAQQANQQAQNPLTQPQPSNAQNTKGVTNPNVVAQEIRSALKSQGLSKYAQVRVTTIGVAVSILADRVFYATDSADIGPIGDRIVDVIAAVVLPKTNAVLVEGYTDNVPVTGGPYTSNWELSAARAANVVDRLNVVDGMPAVRLAAVGYGVTHPAEPNTTAAGRAANRRIEVAILDTTQAG